MPIDTIDMSVSDAVMTVRISRPDKKNAIDKAMYGAMASALAAADSDAAVRVILFAGSEGNFTSGNDLKDFLDPVAFASESPAFRFIRALGTARKPIVAAVEGLAIGIGVTMLLHCDLVVAAKGSKFQMPFVGLGLCPEAGSTFLLPAVMGRQRAAELVLLGDFFDASKARDYGLVNEVTEDGQAEGRARERALALAEKPAASVRLAKELLARGGAEALRETIEREAYAFRERLSSPEAAEAFAAFAARRKPDFSRFG